jgi:hypothetical protein
MKKTKLPKKISTEWVTLPLPRGEAVKCISCGAVVIKNTATVIKNTATVYASTKPIEFQLRHEYSWLTLGIGDTMYFICNNGKCLDLFQINLVNYI